MKIEILDPREEWPKELSHLLELAVIGRGGVLVSFSADSKREEECLVLRAFDHDSLRITGNPPPGIDIEVITERISPDNSKCYRLVFHIFSTDGENAPIEWFKTVASLVELFGPYFTPLVP